MRASPAPLRMVFRRSLPGTLLTPTASRNLAGVSAQVISAWASIRSEFQKGAYAAGRVVC
jgi:hypothetical protein